MSTVFDIESAVQKLSRNDLTTFRDWFLGFDAAVWDKQFEVTNSRTPRRPRRRAHPRLARRPLYGFVRHRANPKFLKFYEQLHKEIQELADANYELLKNDPRHPSLHFKKVGRMPAMLGPRQPRPPLSPGPLGPLRSLASHPLA